MPLVRAREDPKQKLRQSRGASRHGAAAPIRRTEVNRRSPRDPIEQMPHRPGSDTPPEDRWPIR